MILRGEHLSIIDIDDGLTLLRASSWDVEGGAIGPWSYRADIPTPAGAFPWTMPSQGAVWIPWQASSSEPWRGVSPLELCGFTGAALGKVEQSLAWELGTTTGYLLPIPVDGGDDSTAALRTELKTLKGGLSLAETTMSGYGQGKQQAPQKDLETTRLGARPPDALVKVRTDLSGDVLGACGIGAALVGANGEGTARRAALAMFLDTQAAPFVRLLAAELSDKLDQDVTLDLSSLTRPDTVLTRARAAAQLVGAGVAIEEALTASGLRE